MNKYPKSMTMYIPSNLNIEKLLEENPLPPKVKRDHLIYILHLITDLPSKNKDFQDLLYIPLYSKLLQRKIRPYNECVKYLMENGVVIGDGQYIPGKKSKAYRFTPKYQTAISTTKITDRCLIKAILKFHDVSSEEDALIIPLNKENTQNLYFLTKWFNGRLTVDMDGVRKHLLKLYKKELLEENKLFKESKYIKGNGRQRFNRRLLPLLKIQQMDFLPTIDKVAGRLHTVLTQVRSDLRQFIKFDGKPLVAVDICNSQPYLALCLFDDVRFEQVGAVGRLYELNPSHTQGGRTTTALRNAVINCNKSESTRYYRELVTKGQFYEDFAIALSEDPFCSDDKVDRSKAKKVMFSALFSSNRLLQHVQEIQIFKRKFPEIYEIFRLIKINHHNSLACILQSVEANLVLLQACKIISEERPDLPIFTLHDSIITIQGSEDYVHSVLSRVLENAIGEKPTLKYEYWQSIG